VGLLVGRLVGFLVGFSVGNDRSISSPSPVKPQKFGTQVLPPQEPSVNNVVDSTSVLPSDILSIAPGSLVIQDTLVLSFSIICIRLTFPGVQKIVNDSIL